MTPEICSQLGILSDPIRVRLLFLLERSELGVGELVQVVRLPQSTVSRHLKTLLEGGWLQRRSVGTANFFRMLPDALPNAERGVWDLVRGVIQDDPHLVEDFSRLDAVLAHRTSSSSEFFEKVAGSWDALRRDLFGDGYLLPTLLSLLPEKLVVADLGCGTGGVLAALAPGVSRAIGVDREQAMLDVAAQRLGSLDNVSLRQGDLKALPLQDGEVDAAVCMLVLHHVREPERVFAEAARALSPGGRLLLLDMVRHDREEYRTTMGHQHLGFARVEVEDWGREAGLRVESHRKLPRSGQALGPSLFLAVFRKEEEERRGREGGGGSKS